MSQFTPPLIHAWRTLLLLTCLTLALPLQAAETELSNLKLDDLSSQLDIAETTFLQQSGRDINHLDSLTATTVGLEERAQTCITQQEQQQAQTQQAIDSLGKANTDDAADVKGKREELTDQKQQIDKTLSQCRLLHLRATTLLEETRRSRQALLKQQLFAPAASVLTYLSIILLESGVWKTEINGILRTFSSLPLNWTNLWIALAYGITGLSAGIFWSIQKRRQYRETMPPIHATSPTLAAVWISLLRFLPFALFAGVAALSLYFSPCGVPIILQFMLALLLFSLSYGVMHSLLRRAGQVDGVVPANKQAGHQLYFWARLLIAATLIGIVFHSPLLDSASHEVNTPSSLVGLIRVVIGTLIGFALARLIWLMSDHFLFIQRTRLHWMAGAALLIAVASLWLGYRNFAVFLFTGVFGTLFLLLAAWLSLKIPTEIFDGLDEGRTPWQQRLRKQLGLRSTQIVPGLLWLRLANTLVVSGLFLILSLRLWGMPEQNFTLLLSTLANGFKIAGFTLEPLRIIGGLLVLSLLVSLTQVFKKNLAESWLRRTTLSKGAREAITTVSGYSGILVAILLGLSVAGIEFKNLAIIAGALSVGIGFGLQNIVNNFVSGLILLFERPIRRGDWIKVGAAEGYVRDISIRSTTIQTFDRSDIIVPNSEIISGQVTNMMLNDNFGRLILPIGVAYGSDTERVMEILREAADAHPLVIKERTDMKINVFFLGFGDNALSFEVRCFIRDIEAKTAVISDLNLAIDKAFRHQGVEIPFPQRTVHLVKEVPAKPADLG
ncbi:mechanosensitive ion channel family protein [Thiothrix fructosivorans]|uniref:Mechanosensitive ion channel family protein n=1 Tax=Thiothrix fructosivorans TaxID=111770 RepID=A0A8B0SGT3_9GAMM|nr:mechanosensitive ion channel domain-containing protein [Thiothrix fructosivorans]MBO0614836.1 mechanosensitive ion channel family protein [Thiothrix fructosivorans]QTX09650.1 mechanosensitive ion channel family protein [Thiothrix fructosivorans]